MWRVIVAIGGDVGWYSWPPAWAMRGAIDRLLGGPGLRRGRRDPIQLRVGDAVDFWCVEEIVEGALLRLRAEMRVPGRAWLDLGVAGDAHSTTFGQRAVFVPRGLLGRAYWWVLRPVHGAIFGAMSRIVARRAEAAVAPGDEPFASVRQLSTALTAVPQARVPQARKVRAECQTGGTDPCARRSSPACSPPSC